MQPLAHVRRNFILFLRDFFSSGKIVGMGENQGVVYHWEEDKDKTGILIQGANVENPEILNHTPAILVSRSDIQELKEYDAIGKNITGYDWDTGKSTHVSLMGCAITISCLSSNSEEAENLAQIAYFILKMHRSYFSKEYKYRKLVLGGIGTPRIIQYEGEGIKVRVWNAGVIINLTFHTGYRYKSKGDNIERLYVPFVHTGEDDQLDGTHPPVIKWIEDREE